MCSRQEPGLAVTGLGGDVHEYCPPIGRQILRPVVPGRPADVPIPLQPLPPRVRIGLVQHRPEKIADRREAINRAIAQARTGDLVLIAGKGHEDYQIIGREVFHFDDKEVAREALRLRGFVDR